jgi:hypothetical protein
VRSRAAAGAKALPAVLLVHGCARVSIAVLSMNDGSHDYGKQTLRGIFARLLAGLPTG